MLKYTIETGCACKHRNLRLIIAAVLIWAACAASAVARDRAQAEQLDRAIAALEADRAGAIEVVAESENTDLVRLGLM